MLPFVASRKASPWEVVASPHAGRCTIVTTFVDTNILVYAEDRDAGRKHTAALAAVRALWDDRQGVVSVQVLQEYFITVTRKLKKPMTTDKASEAVREYLTWTVVENTGLLLVAAIGLQRRTRLSFWDALIVQAALDADCDLLFSEDLNAGQRFGKLTIVNPLVIR